MDPPTIFPDPDPMLAYLPEEETPGSFFLLPKVEQSKRARFHIIARCSGSDAGSTWIMTMDMSPYIAAHRNTVLANATAYGARNGRTLDQQIMDFLSRDGGWVERE